MPYKLLTRGYGHLLGKQAPMVPWNDVAVDLIGPWSMNDVQEQFFNQFHALTCIDPVTNLVELVRIDSNIHAMWLNCLRIVSSVVIHVRIDVVTTTAESLLVHPFNTDSFRTLLEVYQRRLRIHKLMPQLCARMRKRSWHLYFAPCLTLKLCKITTMQYTWLIRLWPRPCSHDVPFTIVQSECLQVEWSFNVICS